MTQQPVIRSDADLDDAVADLIGPALRRQCWLLFLDADEQLLPVVMPCDDLPEQPDLADASRLAAFIRVLLATAQAAEVVFVLQRPGTRWLTAGERAWRRLLADERLPVHAWFRSSSEGVVRL